MEERVKDILIVEDDMIISLVLEKMVMRLGYEVVGRVTTGEKAIEEAGRLNPDVILMDIRLNGEIDGIEAMSTIQQTLDIPAIYITGNTDQVHRRRAEATDYIDYLIKPVDLNVLARSLQKKFKLAG